MPPQIPTLADFAPLPLPLHLHLPSPPESTTSILILLHGLGDSHPPFASFAKNLNLPGVAAISLRGTSSLPPSMLPGEPRPAGHFHWGDDILLNQRTGEIDAEDPGFENAQRRVLDELVGGVIVGKLGWNVSDILLFGFGQGGSLALGLASRLRVVPGSESRRTAKGVVSIGGPLPASMVPSGAGKSETPVLVMQLDGDEADRVRHEFRDVRVVNWSTTREVVMPRNREEVLPLMRFFADQLNKPYR